MMNNIHPGFFIGLPLYRPGTTMRVPLIGDVSTVGEKPVLHPLLLIIPYHGDTSLARRNITMVW